MGEPSSKGGGEAALAPERAELLAALEAEERRRSQLEAELAEAEARVAALHRDLSNVPSGAVTADDAKVAAPRSPAEKLRLFRQLFRGREDVYPVRFVSKKTGKAGYAFSGALPVIHFAAGSWSKAPRERRPRSGAILIHAGDRQSGRMSRARGTLMDGHMPPLHRVP